MYDGPNQLNRLELPINPAAAAVVPAEIISDVLWAASPAGLTGGVGGALTTAIPDATIAARQA